MNKKIFIPLFTIIFIVVIIISGYYFYKNPVDNNQQNNNISDSSQSQGETCEGDGCVIGTNNITNGIFAKIEDNLLYFKAKNSDEVKSIEMLESVAFFEVTLSESYDVIEEKNIALADFNGSDEIIIFVDADNKVSLLKRIKVEGQITGDVTDGIFAKIEDNLLYFKTKNSDEIKSIELSENIVFLEVTLSESYDVIEEKNIALADFNEGDGVSVFISDSDVDKVSVLSRIIISGSE